MMFSRKRAEEAQRLERERAEEIIKGITQRAERFTQQSWSGLLLVVAFAAMGAAAAVVGYQASKLVLLLIAAALLACATWIAMGLIPRLSKPMLAMTKDGIDTAAYGFIPWESIGGIATSSGGRSQEGGLLLLVPTLPGLTGQMHPCGRARYRLSAGFWKTRLNFPLHRTARINLARRVAESLWEQRTGRRNFWVPNDPELNERLQRVEGEMRRLEAASRNEDPQAALEAMQRADAAMKDFDSLRAKRSRSQTLAVTVLMAIVIVLYAVSFYLKLR